MTPEQYWNGDVWLAKDYYEAYLLIVQRKSEEFWLQGLYNHAAVAIAVGNAFRKKGSSPKSYPQEPLRITPLSEEEKAKKAEEERQKLIDYLNDLEKKWSAKCPVPSAERGKQHGRRARQP